MTAVVTLVIAGGVASALFFIEKDQPEERATPAQGLACPYLQQAAEAYDRGDRTAFQSAIARAAEVAEGTLQKSGQAFGEPERVALELDLAPDQSSARIESLLELAVQGCHDLGIT